MKIPRMKQEIIPDFDENRKEALIKEILQLPTGDKVTFNLVLSFPGERKDKISKIYPSFTKKDMLELCEIIKKIPLPPHGVVKGEMFLTLD